MNMKKWLMRDWKNVLKRRNKGRNIPCNGMFTCTTTNNQHVYFLVRCWHYKIRLTYSFSFSPLLSAQKLTITHTCHQIRIFILFFPHTPPSITHQNKNIHSLLLLGHISQHVLLPQLITPPQPPHYLLIIYAMDCSYTSNKNIFISLFTSLSAYSSTSHHILSTSHSPYHSHAWDCSYLSSWAPASRHAPLRRT